MCVITNVYVVPQSTTHTRSTSHGTSQTRNQRAEIMIDRYKLLVFDSLTSHRTSLM
jgi:hypothetical protein